MAHVEHHDLQRLEGFLHRRLDRLESIILRGFQAMDADLDTLTAALNDETNTIAAKIDKLSADLANAGVKPAQLAALSAISDRLKSLGADPAQPIPPPVV